MQIFEDDDQGLVETLTQQDAFDRFQRALLPDLPVHLRQRIGALDDTEQTEQVRQRILQTRIERERAPGYFLAALARIILRLEVEILEQQLDHGSGTPTPSRARPRTLPAPAIP